MLLSAGRARRHDYRRYLMLQVNRALAKRNAPLRVGTTFLVDKMIELGQLRPAAKVLCVGCRSMREIDYMWSRGLLDVCAIDLFSENRAIQVMDMHHLSFADDSFDVVYASHSLEHAFDLALAIANLLRVARPGALVAIEVPIRFPVSETDLIDFNGVTGLLAAWEPHVAELLFADEQPPRSQTNDQGTEVARIIFRLKKDAHSTSE
jgi:SAM-dependent methyltransferase